MLKKISFSFNFFCLVFLIGIQIIYAQKEQNYIAEEYYSKGKELYFSERYSESLELLKKARDITKNTKNIQLISKISTSIGHAYLLNGEYQKALDEYYFSLDIVQKTDNLNQEIVLLSGLVTTLKRMGQLEEAYKLTTKMIYLVDKSSYKNQYNHLRVLATANEIYMALEQYDSVLYFSDKGIKIYHDHISENERGFLAYLYVEKGMAWYYKKNYEQAFNYLFKTNDLLEKYEVENEFFPTALTNYFLASCYYQQKKYDKAIMYLNKTISKADEQDHKKMFVIQCYLLMANCYGGLKDFEKALKYNTEYMRLNTSYEKEKDATASKIYEKDTQMLQQNLKRLKMERESEVQIKKYTYTTLGLVSILLLVLSLIYIKKQRSNKHIFNDLMAKIDLLEIQQQKLPEKSKSTTGVAINDQKLMVILEKIDQLEVEHYFLHVECTLTTMAKKLKTNATYLSKIINTHKEKNFSSYINDLRIDFVVNRLRQDPVFRKYKIKAIAQEVGFKSAESFAKSFYKRTGLYPSYFLKQLEKKA